MQVVALSWPLEEERRRLLDAAGIPRLLVVGSDQRPPVIESPLEDWIRVPAPEVDRSARVEALLRRAGAGDQAPKPYVDDDGLVRVGRAWVAVPPVEANLARLLADRFGAVVGRNELIGAAWPEGVGERNVLDVRILRLRRRLDQIGLVIRTVRSRGYLMEWPA
ncbi:MAG: winged helix-turn-helix domain-containing protein [Acidimicrobiales bacterium]